MGNQIMFSVAPSQLMTHGTHMNEMPLGTHTNELNHGAHMNEMGHGTQMNGTSHGTHMNELSHGTHINAMAASPPVPDPGVPIIGGQGGGVGHVVAGAWSGAAHT